MKKITKLIALLISIQCISQDIDNLYSNYFQNTREIPYLHLNKTSFLKGEEVWFQSYLIEQNSNKLHPTSSNLYVSVFDESGQQKEQHLIQIKNGIGYGSIPIDSTFTQNNYYIKASTNWMKNFSEDNSFTQKISILSDQKNTSAKTSSQDDFYEFKLMPEGGHLLENTVNNIAVLIKNQNNKGVKTKTGIIKDSNGNSIGAFNTNTLGFANVNLAIKKGEIYTFEAKLYNGTTIKQKTNIPKQIGITLNTKVLDDSFVLNILTNNKSLNVLNGKKYRVFIHNTRSYKSIFFDFNNIDKNYVLLLKKQELFKGANIITLFNEKNQPLLERLIFNDLEDSSSNIKVTTSKINYDSIRATVINYSKEKIFLSSSFLPSSTKAYEPNNNIKSQILLKPYVKGFIENANYYFNASKNKSKDLDLLLLTQGWSKYSWNNIFNNPPKDNFNFENGIDLKLTIKEKLSPKRAVMMFSKENNLIKEFKSNQNPIVLKNTFIKKNSSVDFGLKINDKLLEILPYITYSNYSIKETLNKKHLINYNNFELEVSNFKDLSKDVTVLDEVILEAPKKKINSEPYGAITMLNSVKMKNMIIPSGETIIDFLQFKGFKYTGFKFLPKGISQRGRKFTKYDSEGEIIESTSMSEKKDELLSPEVRVFLDNNEITFNLWIIESMYTNTVKEVFYGRDPGKVAQVIYIYTLSPQEYASKNSLYSTVKIPIGFNQEKEYYSPKYPSYTNSTYKEFGAIFWKPNIILEPNKAITFSVPKNYQKDAIIFIEGISESGQLISKNQLLSFK